MIWRTKYRLEKCRLDIGRNLARQRVADDPLIFSKLSVLSHARMIDSSGRNTIRLLRGFDDDTFLQAHVPELVEEGERLEELDVVTRKWRAKMIL